MAKPRWADLRDSSNETWSGSGPTAQAPVAEDSYAEAPDADLAENSRAGLSARLAGATSVGAAAPRDFAFLLRNARDAAAASGPSASGPSRGPGSGAAGGRRGKGKEFVPGRAAAGGGATFVAFGAAAAAAAGAAGPPVPEGPPASAVDLGGASDGGPSDFSFLLRKRPSDLMGVSESFATGDEDEDMPGGAVSAAAAAAATPTRRRVVRKRRQASSSAIDPSGKRVCEDVHRDRGDESDAAAATPTTGPGGEESLQHRLEKRQMLIEVVKQSPEYRAFAECRARLGAELAGPVPKTPDGTDRTMSKRRWEDEVRLWRLALRHWSPDNAQDPNAQ